MLKTRASERVGAGGQGFVQDAVVAGGHRQTKEPADCCLVARLLPTALSLRLWIGWLVAALGVAGMAVFTAFWVAGDLDAEQGVSLVLGTTLATVLSGVTAYGAGVNIGLGAARLQLAARTIDAGQEKAS
jgi:hypothetical protein